MTDEKPPAAAVMGGRRAERRPTLSIEAELSVTLLDAPGAPKLYTDSVDRTGMVLRTDAPHPVRELLRVEVDLGEEGVLDAVAVVRQSVTPAAARRLGVGAGMAIQLYGLSATDRRRWESFLRRLVRLHGGSTADLGASGLGDALEMTHPPTLDLRDAAPRTGRSRPISREQPWGAARQEVTRPVQSSGMSGLVVAPGDRSGLEEILTRDLILGGLFVPTDRDLERGSKVQVMVRHPQTGSTFPFECVIDRGPERDHQGTRGYGARFLTLDDDVKRRFREFVDKGTVVRATHKP